MTAPENASYACAGALIDELARAGVRHLCLCPGSRSTPLALTAARHPEIRIWTLIDERSMGFFALGMAKALRAPVAVLTTSGTAAANLLPAVVEGRYGRVPLVVLTADRPHEQRDAASPQTIDQVRLYGSHAKWCADLARPRASDDALRYVRTMGSQAAAAARQAPAGPVHLNVPLDEPLVPVAVPDELPPEAARSAAAWAGRPNRLSYVAASGPHLAPDPAALAALAADLRSTPRGVIVCGPLDAPGLATAVTPLAAALGYPILADPLSQVRCGPHDRTLVVDAYDALLRYPAAAAALVPDVILRLGGVPASKPLVAFLERAERARQIVVAEPGMVPDPTRRLSDLVWTDAVAFCDALAAALRRAGGAGAHAAARASMPTAPAPLGAWASRWVRLGATARRAVRERLEPMTDLFEGRVFAELADVLPDGALLYVGNSMPVRDLDTFFPAGGREIRILGNRGANGIDGVVSSALGAAAVHPGPTVLVVGDLSLAHDVGGLLAAKLHGLRAAIVVLNNDGGGIFSFLPQAASPEHFEALFGTPVGLEFRHAAALYGAGYSRADTWAAFRAAAREALGAGDGVRIIEVRTPRRDRNVALHRDVWAAVARAAGGAIGDEPEDPAHPGRRGS